MQKHPHPISEEEFIKAQSDRHTSLTHEYPESPWYEEVYTEFLPYIKEPFLDIGTRSGSLLLGLKSRGIQDVTGLEITDIADHDVEIGRHVVKGDIQKTTPFEGKHFKSATMLHCLEHCHSPELALAEIRRIVDGPIMFMVPAQNHIDYPYAHFCQFDSHYDLANLLYMNSFDILKLYSKGWAVNVVIAQPR